MISLARRYRPRRFADLIVQDHVAAALRGAVAKNRVGHGYLLTGPRGVGKTTAARVLAMALNCESRTPEGEPCGECASCRTIWAGSAELDVVEIDAASNRGVDDARDLRERAMYAASQAGHHKVYIVDEAHMLTREAWNVLLKILEEPPPGVVFVFATTEPQKIANSAAPVLSRLQRFDFRRIGPVAIHARLREVIDAEKLEAEDDALLLIARHADGGMRDALSILDQCLSFGEGPLTADRVRQALGLLGDEAFAEALGAVADRDPAGVFSVMDRVTDAGADLAEFTGGVGEMLRAVVMRHFGAEPEGVPESTRAAVAALAPRIGAEDAVRMLKLLADAEPGIRRGGNPRIAVETLLLRWAMMDRAVDLRALLEHPRGREGASDMILSSPVASHGDRHGPVRAAVAAGAAPGARPAATPTPGLAFSWEEVVSTAARQSPMLGQALGHAIPRWEDPATVVLAFESGSALFQEGVTRQSAVVETIVSEALGGPVHVRIEESAPAASAGAGTPRRLSLEELRSERLDELRSRDPALDAAAKTLDLELVDEE